MAKKLSKRYLALETVRIEFAEYGECTDIAVRTLIEQRISREAWNEAAAKGLRYYKAQKEIT